MYKKSTKLCLALVAAFALIAISVGAGDTGADETVAANTTVAKQDESSKQKYVPKSKAELKKVLTPIQYAVTQEESTERAFTDPNWDNKKSGIWSAGGRLSRVNVSVCALALSIIWSPNLAFGRVFGGR